MKLLYVLCVIYVLVLMKVLSTNLEDEKLTIRVNTFRRNDLLKYFLGYYKECKVIEEIQVVWSDPKNEAPLKWVKEFQPNKVTFEVHDKNSLNNRFRPLIPIKTDAVLSIDDDIIIACNDLQLLLQTWQSNRDVLVGITPRTVSHDPITGLARYLNWQYTWWNGVYSLLLTKASIMHKKYFLAYDTIIPVEVLEFIDKQRNCEDIAMSVVTNKLSRAPPVWTSVHFYDVAGNGISSKTSHFVTRSACVSLLEEKVPGWVWYNGYQKVVRLSLWNTWSLFFFGDNKY